jgi:GNAT superfamily N-acetyltransferase
MLGSRVDWPGHGRPLRANVAVAIQVSPTRRDGLAPALGPIAYPCAVVRAAVQGDEAAISALQSQVELEIYPDEAQNEPQQQLQNLWLGRLQARSNCVAVAVQGREVRGLAWARFHNEGDDLPYDTILEILYVHDAARSEGHGRELIRAVARWAVANERHGLMVGVRENLESAVRLYVSVPGATDLGPTNIVVNGHDGPGYAFGWKQLQSIVEMPGRVRCTISAEANTILQRLAEQYQQSPSRSATIVLEQALLVAQEAIGDPAV